MGYEATEGAGKAGRGLALARVEGHAGFGGPDIPGVYCKFCGDPDRGPWFYLVKDNPGTVVGKHSHDGNVIHYLLEGTWKRARSFAGRGGPTGNIRLLPERWRREFWSDR